MQDNDLDANMLAPMPPAVLHLQCATQGRQATK